MIPSVDGFRLHLHGKGSCASTVSDPLILAYMFHSVRQLQRPYFLCAPLSEQFSRRQNHCNIIPGALQFFKRVISTNSKVKRLLVTQNEEGSDRENQLQYMADRAEIEMMVRTPPANQRPADEDTQFMKILKFRIKRLSGDFLPILQSLQKSIS